MEDMGNGVFRDGEWEYTPVGKDRISGKMLYDRRRWNSKIVPYHRDNQIPEDVLEHVAIVLRGRNIAP